MNRAVPQANSTGTGRRIASRRNNGKGRKIAFGWYGGKFSHLDFILPNIPLDAQHFCDVFGGSAAVLINRQPAPVETYNDIDSELVNFFRTLRDDSTELLRAISLTPFSREELARACEYETRSLRARACQAILRTGATDADGSRAAEQRGALGPLRPYFQGRHGWGGIQMAGFRRRARRDYPAAPTGPNRERPRPRRNPALRYRRHGLLPGSSLRSLRERRHRSIRE